MIHVRPSKRRATTELIGASLIWGFGFIAARWTLQTWTPFWAVAWRFTLAFLVTAPFYLWPRKDRPALNSEELKVAVFPSILMGFVLLFQTWGLAYTTATKSGFITCLYVTFVPLLEWLLFRKKINLYELGAIVVGLLGMATLSGGDISNLNFGDALTLLCAISAAAHIVLIGRLQDRIHHPFRFNALQSGGAAVVNILAAMMFEPARHLGITVQSVFGLLWLGFASTALAFGLQIRAQRVLNPLTASLIFLLEAPFASLFAFLLLGERLDPTQMLGCALVLLSAGIAIIGERIVAHKTSS